MVGEFAVRVNQWSEEQREQREREKRRKEREGQKNTERGGGEASVSLLIDDRIWC